MKLRIIIFEMCVDIEHYLKIFILNKTETILEEDGYNVVNCYLNDDFSNEERPKRIHQSIYKKLNSSYSREILNKYFDFDNERFKNIPLWEFLEIITFGELIDFYDYFIKKYNITQKFEYIFILKEIVKLRNAVAHNNCILSDLSIKDNLFKPDNNIIMLLRSYNISLKTINNKMYNSRIRQITYLFIMYNMIVTSKEKRISISKSLNKFINKRVKRNKEYYKNNNLLKSTFTFFETIIIKEFKYKN